MHRLAQACPIGSSLEAVQPRSCQAMKPADAAGKQQDRNDARHRTDGICAWQRGKHAIGRMAIDPQGQEHEISRVASATGAKSGSQEARFTNQSVTAMATARKGTTPMNIACSCRSAAHRTGAPADDKRQRIVCQQVAHRSRQHRGDLEPCPAETVQPTDRQIRAQRATIIAAATVIASRKASFA